MTKRYAVRYAHLDGNTYPLAEFDTLDTAQRLADRVDEIARKHLPVVVWDGMDEERGDLRGVEQDDDDDERDAWGAT